MWEFCTIELVYSVILLISALDIGFIIAYPYASGESILDDIKISKDDLQLTIGITYLTAISGSYVSDLIFYFLRRKTTLIIFISFNTLLWFILPFLDKETFWITYIDRGLTGIILGSLTSILPIYLIELSPKESTGFFGALFQFSVSFGLVTCELLGNYLNWKMISYIGGGICLFFLFMIWFCPDSPVSMPSNASASANTQSTATDNILFHNSIFYLDFIKKIIYGLILFFFQNFTGITGMMYNIPDIFKIAGNLFPDKMAYTISCMVVVFFSFIGCFIHHFFGRKVPWIISSTGIFISLLIQVVYLKVKMPQWIPFLTLFMFLSFFGLSLSSYPFFALAEENPPSVRSFAVAIGSSFSWTLTLLLFLFYKPVEEYLGEFVVLIISMVFALLSIVFGFFFVDKPDLSLFEDSYYGIEIDERTSNDD